MDENKLYSDDLFKNAGDNYPLNTDNANWQEVFGRIKSPQKTPPPVFVKSAQNINWRYAWLLLLLLIPAGIWMNNNFKTNQHVKPEISKINLPTPKNDLVKPVDPVLPQIQNSETDASKNSAGNIDVKESNRNTQQNFISPAIQLNENEVAILNNDEQAQQYLPFIAGKTIAFNNLLGLHSNKISLKDLHTAKTLNLIEPANKEIDISLAENNDAINENSNAKRTAIKLKTKERFYLSISAGPSFSSVKTQSIPKAGYSLGMLLGYNVNKNIDIETGVLFVKKYFKADGAEFNKDVVKLPEGTSIISLDGAANITQVPLNVIYNFNSKKSSNFFASANLITNVIHSESYNYKLTGNENFDVLSRSYRKGSDKLFSNLSFGVGYTQNLGKDWKMSVEPYYQLPLSGIGLGDLHVQTFGINLKISKTVQKK
ncbi:MAG: hypothetical protein ABI653_03325 [Bacteroidota bacterium]